jgi:hypothetical protein
MIKFRLGFVFPALKDFKLIRKVEEGGIYNNAFISYKTFLDEFRLSIYFIPLLIRINFNFPSLVNANSC